MLSRAFEEQAFGCGRDLKECWKNQKLGRNEWIRHNRQKRGSKDSLLHQPRNGGS
jgi:hypothetical protein